MAGKERRAKVEFDIGLGGLFKGIGSLFDLVFRMTEEGKKEYTHTTVEQFGNIRKTAQSGGGNYKYA